MTANNRILGKKWTIPVLEQIAMQRFEGFNKFISASRITPRGLSMILKTLEEVGVVEKTKDGLDKISTKYNLTDKGHELYDLLQKMKIWNLKWSEIKSCMSSKCIFCQGFNDGGMGSGSNYN